MSRGLRVSLWLLLPIMMCVAGFALMPLGFAANLIGVQARYAQGSILDGALRDVSTGPLKLGDVNARLAGFRLVRGQLGFALNRGKTPQDPGVSGVIGTGVSGLFAQDLSATLVSRNALAGIGMADISLDRFSVQFDDGKCDDASGRVRLKSQEAAFSMALREGLTGEAQCDGNDVLIPLASQSAMEKLIIRISGTGRYTVTIRVASPPPDMMVALELAGFQPVAGGYQLVRSGQLRK